MSDTYDLKDIKRRMDGAITSLRTEFSGLRTGRAHTALLDNIQVEAYGSNVPINQVGAVSAPEPRMLTVQVWDKGMLGAVEKALRNSNLGINPMTDGMLIRIPMPPLTEERRRDLTKVASGYSEQAKVSVRNVRRDGMDTLKREEKSGDISEDEQKRAEKDVQSATNDVIKQIDDMLETKPLRSCRSNPHDVYAPHIRDASASFTRRHAACCDYHGWQWPLGEGAAPSARFWAP